jgi:hypothetical protein
VSDGLLWWYPPQPAASVLRGAPQGRAATPRSYIACVVVAFGSQSSGRVLVRASDTGELAWTDVDRLSLPAAREDMGM